MATTGMTKRKRTWMRIIVKEAVLVIAARAAQRGHRTGFALGVRRGGGLAACATARTFSEQRVSLHLRHALEPDTASAVVIPQARHGYYHTKLQYYANKLMVPHHTNDVLLSQHTTTAYRAKSSARIKLCSSSNVNAALHAPSPGQYRSTTPSVTFEHTHMLHIHVTSCIQT